MISVAGSSVVSSTTFFLLLVLALDVAALAGLVVDGLSFALVVPAFVDLLGAGDGVSGVSSLPVLLLAGRPRFFGDSILVTA